MMLGRSEIEELMILAPVFQAFDRSMGPLASYRIGQNSDFQRKHISG